MAPEDSHGTQSYLHKLNVTSQWIPLCRIGANAPSDGCANTFTAYLAEPRSSGAAWTNQHGSSRINCISMAPVCLYTRAVEMRMALGPGYLALGLENPGGGHNGMNGMTVMGIYDPDEKVHGGESWLNFVGTGVKELKIRHTVSIPPLERCCPNCSALSLEHGRQSRFGSSMYFKTKTIHGIDRT